MSLFVPQPDSGLIERFAEKTTSAWRSLQKYRAHAVSDAEINHLFARYVFGLTSPAYGAVAPADHLDVCRAFLVPYLDEAAAEQALCEVPPATQSWVERAYAEIEKLGLRDGEVYLAVQAAYHHQTAPEELQNADATAHLEGKAL